MMYARECFPSLGNPVSSNTHRDGRTTVESVGRGRAARSSFSPRRPMKAVYTCCSQDLDLDVLRSDPCSSSSSQEEVERLCMRNLLADPNERFFFKDLESRFLLVSAGFLAALAQGRPLEKVIGKTDFDIFSTPHALAAFEDEQRVIATGRAMVAKVERETFHDRSDVWVSTTKLTAAR